MLSVRGSMNSVGRRVLIGRAVVVAGVDPLARLVAAPSRARADRAPVQLRQHRLARPPGRRPGRRAGPASDSRAWPPRRRPARPRRRGAISLPRFVVHCVRLAPNATMRSLSEISSSAAGEAKPPLMPTDQGLPANSPWPQIEVASSAPMRSASAISAASAPASTAPRPARMSGRSRAANRIRQPRARSRDRDATARERAAARAAATLPASGASCTSVGRLSTTVWRSRSARMTARSVSSRAVAGV